MRETLAARLGTRERDHFLLIRLLAAIGVIVTHSLAIAGDPPEALERRLGLSFGQLAVDTFFVISGLLVTSSLFARRNLPSFLAARALRLLPVLVVGAFGAAFVVGPWQTDLPLRDYLTHPATWTYAFQNSFPWPWGVAHTLPGVFRNVPLAGAVNGSLWSLPFEITMYAALAALGALAFVGRRPVLDERGLRRAIMGLAAALLLGHTAYEWLDLPRQFHVENGLRLGALFFAGAALFVGSDRVPRSGRLALMAAALFVANVLLPRPLAPLYVAPLAYLVIMAAYAPGGPLDAYRRAGDYSYGTYVYAFPIGQCVAATLPGAGTAVVFTLTLAFTLALAIPSWHLLEKPLLRLSPRVSRTGSETEIAEPRAGRG